MHWKQAAKLPKNTRLPLQGVGSRRLTEMLPQICIEKPKPQTEFAVWVSWQICYNLSVSAPPSQLPW